MARCFCACHEFPGTYPPPCGVCGHHNDYGRYPGATNMGWVPDGEEVGPLRIDATSKWRPLAEAAQEKVQRLELLLARAYPFLTWRDEVRGVDPSLDAEFDAVVRDVEVAIQHLPDERC